MHISEGVLSAPVLASGIVMTLGGLALGIRSLDMDNMPKAAIMSAVFFCGSFIHINFGPGSVHLVLNGLIGILMGWAAFPSILIALLLQGILFQFGGLTTLGINTLNVAGPAVLCGLCFRRIIKNQTAPFVISMAAGITGGISVALTGLMAGLSLYFTGPEYSTAAYTIFIMHIPVIAIEMLITFFCIGFLLKVMPGLIQPTEPISLVVHKE